MEHFPSVGVKISIEIPMGIKNLLFPAEKIPVGMVFEYNFFYSISNGDKAIFLSGIEILANFSSGEGFTVLCL